MDVPVVVFKQRDIRKLSRLRRVEHFLDHRERLGVSNLPLSHHQAQAIVELDYTAPERKRSVRLQFDLRRTSDIKISQIPAFTKRSENGIVQRGTRSKPKKTYRRAEVGFARIVGADQKIHAGRLELEVQQTLEIVDCKTS
jgi:hypothetical protein